MTDPHLTWITAATEAASYRRMYLLAAEIVGSDAASQKVRKAAGRVVRVLEDVVEKPIAEAVVLARARKKFRELVAALEQVSAVLPALQTETPPDNGAGRR